MGSAASPPALALLPLWHQQSHGRPVVPQPCSPRLSLSTALSLRGLRSSGTCGTNVQPQPGEGQGHWHRALPGTPEVPHHLFYCPDLPWSLCFHRRKESGEGKDACGQECQKIINCLVWKSPLRSSPAPALPTPPPAHSPKVCESHQGWGPHHYLEQLC